jgi:hypothetical protein
MKFWFITETMEEGVMKRGDEGNRCKKGIKVSDGEKRLREEMEGKEVKKRLQMRS